MNTNEVANLIGHMSFQYSYLDYLISNIVWSSLELKKDVGVIITGSLDIYPKLDMAISLLEELDNYPNLLSSLKSLKNRMQKTNSFVTKRNLYIHGVFSSRDKDSIVMIESHRNKKNRKKKPIEQTDIQQTLNEILNEIKILIPLMKKENINID